jgi:hypothetical protein
VVRRCGTFRAAWTNWRSGGKYTDEEHYRNLDRRTYGFCYDDGANQAAFFSGKGREVVVTLYWD